MLLSRHRKESQNQDIQVEIANTVFENASQFRYLGTMVTNQYSI
jgi:hypothetical protein